MAHYISLTSKATKEVEPFYTIDDKLCDYLGIEPSQTKFYTPPNELNWYDSIGLLCINKSLATFANELEEYGSELAIAIRWLDDNYILNSWFGA